MSDYRINIGNGKVIINTYTATQQIAEQMMHDLIAAVSIGEIYVEQKSETWEKIPT